MSFLKSLLKVFSILLILLLILSIYYIQHLKPTYEGELDLGLNETTQVYFDTYGIPHIYSQNNTDAYKALGYVHAQERLWQMELLRRIAPGRLAEVFGSELIKNDKLFRSIGIAQQSKRIIASGIENKDSYPILVAYLDGVNTFIDNGYTPIEYQLVGLEKSHFTIEDIFNITGYMAFSFAAAQKTDPLVSYIQTNLGDDYLADLMLDYDPNAVFITNEDKRTAKQLLAYSALVEEVLSQLPLPTFNGSNSWVVNKEKTSSGNVLFANDPHIGYAQPAVWYEAHLSTPNYERYGYHLGGVPFPLLSHNRSYAFGLTMFENDDIDFYEEQVNDQNQYKTDSGWSNFQIREEIIQVKDADPVHFTVRETHHGPIVNDIIEGLADQKPIAMYWIYTQLDRNLLHTLFEMNTAESMEDFESKIAHLHAPGLNIMYGDEKGNIAWWATAQLYNRLDNNHSKMIKHEVFDADKHIEMIPFDQNPHAVNPSSGYVYSANNAAKTMDGNLVPGYYAPENRAKRIVELLEPKNDWDKISFAEMLLDDTSSVLPQTVIALSNSIDRTVLTDDQLSLLNELSSWKGNYPLNSYLPSIYHRWEFEFIKYCFEDELGEQLTQELINTHLSKKFISPLMAKDSSIWFDRINTNNKENHTQAVTSSFINAITALVSDYGPVSTAWNWGELHQVEHQHPLGRVPLLKPLFNVGPYPIRGAREVINAVNFNYSYEQKNFTSNAGPSTRRIIDFSDIEHSISVLPTGQSGNPFSPHYDDQVQLYNDGDFRPMLLNKKEIVASSKNVLIIN